MGVVTISSDLVHNASPYNWWRISVTVSSVAQCTKANLKCLKKLFPESWISQAFWFFPFTRSRYEVCFTGMPRGILKRVLELTLFNDLSQHKRLLIDQDQTMTLGTTCPTLIKQCHGFLNVPFRLIQKVKAGERILFPHHLLEMRNFHSNVSNLWAIQNLTEIAFIFCLLLYC